MSFQLITHIWKALKCGPRRECTRVIRVQKKINRYSNKLDIAGKDRIKLLKYIKERKANWLRHMLRWYYLFGNVIVGGDKRKIKDDNY